MAEQNWCRQGGSETMAEKDILKHLNEELERLKRTLGLGHELKLRWIPNNARGEKLQFHGEVHFYRSSCKEAAKLDPMIYVYDSDEAEALHTLRHEFLEYVLAREFTAPYERLVAFAVDVLCKEIVQEFEREAYTRREQIINRLADLIASLDSRAQATRGKPCHKSQ